MKVQIIFCTDTLKKKNPLVSGLQVTFETIRNNAPVNKDRAGLKLLTITNTVQENKAHQKRKIRFSCIPQYNC